MKASFVCLIFLLSFSAVSCLKNGVVVVPAAKQSSSSLSIGLSMRDAPSDVGSITGILSREGYDTLKNDFTVSIDSAVCQFDNVAVGTWHLQVDAYDGSNSLKYAGNTDVQVLPDQTTPIKLTLDTTSGSIYATVTWGAQDTTNPDMALEFDGSSGSVSFAASEVLQPQSVTIEMNVFMQNLSPAILPFLAPTNADLWNTADGYCTRYETANGTGYFSFSMAKQPNLCWEARANYTPTTNKWTHLAFTYDKQYECIYVDGNLVTKKADTTSIYYGSHGFSLGYAYASYAGGPFYFKGAMDELRIWNYALTQEEIDTSMNSKLTGKEPGLVGYWDFNQNASDAYALDRTGNGNNGQLVGGVQFIPVDSIGN